MGDDSDDWDGLEDEDDLEQLAVVSLCDPDDPTLLTRKELKESWGSCTNFMFSYGLKPYNPEDIDEALAISRALKENDDDDAASRLKIWIDGASKGNHISGIGRIGGVGVVFDDPNLPKLYGPVEFNLTEKVTNNAAELQAAILGLEQAKERGFNMVEVNTDSQFLKNVMTDWLEKWKAKNWRKSDGKPVKISVDLVKKLDLLRSVLDIEWNWLPRNSCPEMILADALANHGCEVYLWHQPQELEGNKLFRRTMYDRRLSYPDDLPPTVLRTKDQVLISSSKTVKICCTLDISERLKNKLIENKTHIMTMASDQAYGYVMCMRTMDKLSKDCTVMAKCHTFGSENVRNKDVRPTLVLPRGSIVGIGFSGAYGRNDDQADKNLMGMLFFTDINEK